jgi:hypothetical protein
VPWGRMKACVARRATFGLWLLRSLNVNCATTAERSCGNLTAANPSS